MARVIRTLSRSFLSHHPSPSSSKTLIHHQKPKIIFLLNPSSQCMRRTYIPDMRKSAFESNILRLLRNEIGYELERASPSELVTKYNSFVVDNRPGEQWVRLKRKFAENEDIRIEVTMFDGAVPATKSGGGNEPVTDMQLHITLIVNISKGDNVLEILCSAWPDTLEITKLYVRETEKMPSQPYAGPEFKELDDELQDSLYGFLEARGIDDELATFLHKHMKNKDKTEFIRWMGIVKSIFEKK